MNIFKLICKCGSSDTNIFSCVEKGKAIEIIYICNDCGRCEKVMEYLYKMDKREKKEFELLAMPSKTIPILSEKMLDKIKPVGKEFLEKCKEYSKLMKSN